MKLGNDAYQSVLLSTTRRLVSRRSTRKVAIIGAGASSRTHEGPSGPLTCEPRILEEPVLHLAKFRDHLPREIARTAQASLMGPGLDHIHPQVQHVSLCGRVAIGRLPLAAQVGTDHLRAVKRRQDPTDAVRDVVDLHAPRPASPPFREDYADVLFRREVRELVDNVIMSQFGKLEEVHSVPLLSGYIFLISRP